MVHCGSGGDERSSGLGDAGGPQAAAGFSDGVISANMTMREYVRRAGIVLEYMLEKTWLPPPFNIFIYVSKIAQAVARFVLRRVLAVPEAEDGPQGFALFMSSARQLEVQGQERGFALSVVQNLAAAKAEPAEPPSATEVAKRFEAIEEKLSIVLDKIAELGAERQQ